jgi:adenylate cyclase
MDKNEQWQTIINLFDSGIPLEIIALQLDIDLDEVNKIIQNISNKKDIEKKYQITNSSNASKSVFYLDAIVDIQEIISNSQSNMWKALRTDPVFTFPFDETQELLSNYSNSKIKSIILHIDIVGSTKLSMTLPIERLSKIIQAFTQEMTKVIRLYGGYVLKYIGDAIIGFFNIHTDNLYLPCINAINCAKTMIKVIKQGFNPVLNQYDYPEMGVRIGIDYGENVVVKYLPITENLSYFKERKSEASSLESKIDVKKPIYDILGYTISITTKMTAYAKVDHIIVGQLIYDILSREEQSYFSMVDIRPENWNYISDETGLIYKLYINKT